MSPERRWFLGILCGGVATAALARQANADHLTLILRHPQAIPPPPVVLKLRSNDIMASPDTTTGWTDFTNAWVAAISAYDVSNLIALSVTAPVSGTMNAFVWLDRAPGVPSVTNGGSGLYHRRELLDNFAVQSVGAIQGLSAGSLVLQSYTGPNGTGTLLTQTLTFMCDNTPPATWQWGADTLPTFGNFNIIDWAGGNAADWTITSQTTPGQFVPRVDTTNNVCCAVLAGATPTSGSPVPSPTIAFPAGNSSTLVFTNTSTAATFTTVFNSTANRFDAMPWAGASLIGAQTCPADIPGNGQQGDQRTWFWRYFTKSYPKTCVLGSGTWLDQTIVTANGTTFTPGISPTGAPVSPFLAQATPDPGWDWQGVGIINSQYITQTSRFYLGADVGQQQMNVAFLNRAGNPNLGFRFTNLRSAYLNIQDASNPTTSQDQQMADHNMLVCRTAGGSFSGTSMQLGSATVVHTGIHVIANYATGSIQHYGQDIMSIGNRSTTTAASQDARDFTMISSAAGSGRRSKELFDFFINKQGQDSPTHEDYNQAIYSNPPYAPTGLFTTGDQVGVIIFMGVPRIGGSGTGFLPVSGGQGPFMGDWTLFSLHNMRYGGGFYSEQSGTGLNWSNNGTGVRVNWSAWLFAHYSTPTAFLGSPPIARWTGTDLTFQGSVSGNILTVTTQPVRGGVAQNLVANLIIYSPSTISGTINAFGSGGTTGTGSTGTYQLSGTDTWPPGTAFTASDYNGTGYDIQAQDCFLEVALVGGGFANNGAGAAFGLNAVYTRMTGNCDLTWQLANLNNPQPTPGTINSVGDVVNAFGLKPGTGITNWLFNRPDVINHRAQTYNESLLFP